MKKVKFNIVCASRSACPEVKNFLYSIGFESVDEIFDDPTADLQATVKVQNTEQMRKIVSKLSSGSKEKISQITVTA